MNISIFHIAHLFSLFILVGIVFAAIVAPKPEYRKQMLIWSGVASLGVMLSGFGLAGILKVGWPSWVFVKIFCWLSISILVGQAFRRENKRGLFGITASLMLLAVVMVYLRP